MMRAKPHGVWNGNFRQDVGGGPESGCLGSVLVVASLKCKDRTHRMDSRVAV